MLEKIGTFFVPVKENYNATKHIIEHYRKLFAPNFVAIVWGGATYRCDGQVSAYSVI